MSPIMSIVLAGAVTGVGLAVLVATVVQGRTPIRLAMRNLGPDRVAVDTSPDVVSRLGSWGTLHLAGRARWLAVPRQDLALLGIPVDRYYGDKIVRGLVGLALPPLVALVWSLAVVAPPPALPGGGGLLLGLVLFFSPDLDVRSRARRARVEVARSLGAYIELVALERIGGAGAGQSLDSAAVVGDNWVFRRLRAELDRARLSGVPAWTHLRGVADELGLPELADLADIIRLSGGEGAAVYETLRGRARTLRSGLLQAEHTRANATSERLTFPVVVLAVSFLLILLVAQGMRLAEIGP